MGKSSSSRTKKRSKVSSEARTRKKSKSKTKTREYRSKKLRRRDDSSSYSGEDDSRSLKSLSSFSSDDDLRSRRARSRARKDAKGSKKRAQRRSYSPDSSGDSPRRKKRKLAKKKNDKKTHLRKKPRRNVSVSSRSSASFRCSTCPSESISGDEIESKRHRGRPGKRNRVESGINKVESGTKKARYRSRSCSLCSQRSESGDCRSEEKVTYENNSRRLRSVVTVAEENEHGRWMDTDAHKEEITYDDDYPSCRSNDSNDGGGKRELDDRLDVAFEKRTEVESGKEEEAYVSNVLVMDLKDSCNILEKDCTGQDDGIGISGPANENKNEVSGAIISLPGEDLESILRQRALENLKRFKGKHQRISAVTTNQEDKTDIDLTQPSTAKVELVQIESPREGGARVVVAKSSEEDVAERVDATQSVEEANGPQERVSILSSQNLKKEPDRINSGSEFISAKQDVACPIEQVGCPIEQVAVGRKIKTTASLYKPNSTSPTLRGHLLEAHQTLKQEPASQEPPEEGLLVSESNVDKGASDIAQTVPQRSNRNGEDIKDSSDMQQDEATDGSQFEQKTMSVMRGSEMVQVSYKVYIPKKAPALARRQLKR
ncbi:uncharacterized protein LOC126589595 [Malus sylvestris]|uniref:Uncharacterized protein n=1 Tax=Malus domestica TaxID=3750 RepID=A0A498IPP1_MALDO|nr:uncharacterized protein LOC126589595 [Malus sylvestris]RXH83193.1 hypothetical protein DVH24_003691 [Malus domestica]